MPLVEQSREHRAGQAPAGVGHVVEADVHRRPCRCRRRRGSGSEWTAEFIANTTPKAISPTTITARRVDAGGQADGDRGGERRQREGQPGRGPAVGLAPRAPRRAGGRSRGPRPARSRSRSPRSPGSRRSARSSSRGRSRGRPGGRRRTRRRARRRGRCGRAARTLTARLLENMCLNLALRVGAAEVPVHQPRDHQQGDEDDHRPGSASRLEPGQRQQQPAEEEADALERVL